MDIFDIHQQIIGEYESFVESFIDIKDEKIRQKVDQELSEGKLWPEPLIQFNPSYKKGESVENLCKKGVLHPEVNNIFKGYDLYDHQVKALEFGTKGEDFIVTSGTGSGKSLTYLGTIFDYVLCNPDEDGVKAIIVYPMNALINSQYNEIEKYESNYVESGKEFPIQFAQYTGQEGDTERERIIEEQPDIILTNYMMMELIMTRLREKNLRESFKQSLKFLVFDELHTYRGRQGSDVAMQIRRIRSACRNDLVCIGTSATMATGSTLLEQREAVADVGKTIFGKKFTEGQVIDEAFELGFEELNPKEKKQKLIQALDEKIDINDRAENLKKNALGAWLERDIGLQEKEGQYVRQKPRTLNEISEKLSELTEVEVEWCAKKIRQLLKWAEQINVKNEDKGIRKKWLPYKLHQFISQTGSVHVKLISPAERDIDEDIKLDAGYFTVEEGESVPLYPVVFSRVSGHEFICVKKNEADLTLEQRDFNEQTSEEDEEQDLSSGYIVFDHDELVWRYDDITYLPDSWKTKKGEIRKKYKEKVPHEIWVDRQGNYSLTEEEGYVKAWFIKSPLPFDPTAGAFYHGSTSEYTKLTKLGSEARSTATSVISQATVKALKEANYDKEASKLLSFTDVRQDASLQAGHFNDFTKTVRLRAAIYKALNQADDNSLDHSVIAQSVFKTLDLREEEYAQNPLAPDAMHVVNHNEEALKKKLLYDLLYDLKYGWRVTLPNLEQCGLLKLDYAYLDEISKKEGWNDIPGFSDMMPEQRREILYQILDYFRKKYAIAHESLKPDRVEENEKKISDALNEEWGFDKNERIERPNWMRFSPFDRKPKKIPTESIGYLSKLGRYLKELPELEEHITGKESYRELLGNVLYKLSGTYFKIEEVPDRGSGETKKIYQLLANAIIWKQGDGETLIGDPVNNRSYKNTEAKINTYFRDLYKNQLDYELFFNGSEHTGQINNEQRQNREEEFKKGDINALFCSPTMELGIDIADLNVVHMRNVPPNPANYAQRSGRAGRSGQAALAFTYCANYSSHDRHYFKNSKDMVAGEVLPPRMDMHNEELIMSHLNAICLSEIGLRDLNDSLANVLDLGNEDNLPIKEEVKLKFDFSDRKKLEIKKLFNRVISDIKSDLPWYSEEWLDSKINDVFSRFSEALERWRSLYKDAISQRRTAQNILDNPTYQAGSSEKKLAGINEDQARRQIALLKNEYRGGGNLSEFYPYRYLASEGFLPGYNFTRLPIRAYMPSHEISMEGDYLSRPRNIALREFGPGNIIYHNGSTYSVTRMNVNDASQELTRAKVAKKSGYILDGKDFENELCPFTKEQLDDDNSREIINNLTHMGEVQTRPRKRISCNEEERQSRGYEIDTYFKVDGSMDRVRNIELKGREGNLMTMRYIPAAQLYFINRRWRTSTEKGFLLNLTTGEWEKGNIADKEKEESVDEFANVQLYVKDTADAIYLHPTSSLGLEYEGVITLQYALKNAIEQVFRVEPNEIRVELMGDKEAPNILVFEASEGSLGVLKTLSDQPRKFREVVEKAYEICHFTKPKEDEKELPQASYDDLLSYYNQYHHKLLDRHKIKGALELLKAAEPDPKKKGTNRNYSEQLDYLRERIDPNSGLEEKFLNYLADSGLALPDKAQYSIDELYVNADFFYEPNVVIFVDGNVHDKPGVQTEDEKKRKALRKKGYQVLVYRYDQDFNSFVESRPDIFKEVQI
ncbi:DEAD/DEAH box helicase [Halalkalibaculum sp. DA384]|uniref:DEAD/DEAH box helicase n=1 Tax=Halalkalibaculum sp. DA384 TaxID=3373606 RepID=UPI0037553F25